MQRRAINIRYILTLALACFGLAAMPKSAEAASITINDALESGLVTSLVGIDSLTSVVLTNESWSFNAILHIPFGQGVIVGKHSFVLTDASGISDFLTVFSTACNENGGVGTCQPGPNDFLQSISVLFQSDTDAGPLTLPTGTIDCNFVETGAPQLCNIRGSADATLISLSITSDAADTAVPEPATLTLLGLGLAGVGLLRRKTA